MAEQLLNIIMHDGSRHFADLPESASWEKLQEHIALLSGVTDTKMTTDHVTEAWIDFNFRGHKFSVNNQFGNYWFFVEDPETPDEILAAVLDHCRGFL